MLATVRLATESEGSSISGRVRTNEPVEQVSAIYPPQRLLTRLSAQTTTTAAATTTTANKQTNQTTITNKQTKLIRFDL